MTERRQVVPGGTLRQAYREERLVHGLYNMNSKQVI